MRVIGQLAQVVLLLVLVGCLARLLQFAISHNAIQRQCPPVGNRPVWVRDQRGGAVLPGGDVGGDTQISESFSVRFWHRDRPGAMVTYCYYAAANLHDPAAISVDCQTEYLVCADPDDPGGTEVWSAYRYCTLRPGFATVQAATDAAFQTAQGHLVCEESWSGRAPWEST
jgi:hypothetical protein